MNIPKKINSGFLEIKDDILLKKILQDVDPIRSSSSDKLFLFNHVRGRYYLKLYSIFAHALSKKGYPSCFLFRDCLVDRYLLKIKYYSKNIDFSNILSLKSFEIGKYFSNLKIDDIEINNSLIEVEPKIKIINKNLKKDTLYYNWDIDLKNEIVTVMNINFFPLIRTTLRAVLKRYNINFINKEIISKSKQMIHSMDLLLRYLMLFKKYSKEKKKEIKIIGWEYNYIPNGFFNIGCKELTEDRDIEYIDISRGYKHYFGGHNKQSYFSAVNLTRSAFRNRNTIPKKELLKIIDNIDKNEIVKPINIIIKKSEKTWQINDVQKPIIDKCNKFLNQGNNVFVLISHLFYDNPIYDCTDAFEDMCDWINYTINIFKNSKDLLLLKPHPKEIRPEIPEADPNETLESYIKENYPSLPDNIVLLKPRTFKLYQLISFVSCGLIWKSSAANELSYLGKTCIITGPSPFKQALDDLNYAKSKKHYEFLIKNVNQFKVTERQKTKIAAYIYALYNKDTEIKEFTNEKKYNTPYLDKEEIFNYLKNGNVAVNKIVEDLIK